MSSPAVDDSGGSGTRQPGPERPQPSPPQHDPLASADPDDTEPHSGLGLPTHNAVTEQPRLEPSGPGPVQSDIQSGPDRTEPHGPNRQLAATEAWAHHTDDLDELTHASKDLLAEVKFVKETVRHCNIILGFHQLTRAQ